MGRHKRVQITALCLLCLWGAKTTIQAEEAPFFVIGVFVPPPNMMSRWKERGVNTAVGVPEGQDQEAWSEAAAANGLRMICPPAADPAQDADESQLLAWLLPDEPSNVGPDAPGVEIEHVVLTPQEIDATAREWKKALPKGTRIPFYLNLTGAHVNDERINASLMADYVDGASTDIVAHDYYTINSNAPMIYELDGYVTTRQGRAIDRLKTWSGGKPQHAFIETSDINRKGSLPSAGDMRAEIWSAIIHGAVAIVYFPIAFDPFSFDETPEPLVAEMFASHTRIKELERLLLDSPTGLPRGELHRMAPDAVVPKDGMMPYPFEARSYQTERGTYVIVLNLSPKGEAVLDNRSFGIFDLQFRPYEVKAGYVKSGGLQETPP